MTGAQRASLKIVGGNAHLRPIPKSQRHAAWPPLRVVGVDHIVPPAVPPGAVSMKAPPPKRPTWGLVWAVGIALILAQCIEQAIGAHHG